MLVNRCQGILYFCIRGFLGFDKNKMKKKFKKNLGLYINYIICKQDVGHFYRLSI